MIALVAAFAMQQTLTALPPLPTSRQLAWHGMERYVFVHFGPNTFTGAEWGSGKESEQIFNPKHLDCAQWCRAFKAAGFRGVIITAKHHDGFCLWPSKYSTHTVAQSPWKGGKGDVLKELSKACHAEGLKFGVYLSPWDRNHPAYGTPAYNEVFKNMLREVLTRYGPIFEVWFDGANGEGPNGKRQVYDWPGFVGVVRQCQPKACIFSDAGPDIRWCGNESGSIAETNWNFIDRSRVKIGGADPAYLNTGDEAAPDYVPAECDVSIRPGWFWRASEDAKVKSVDQLLDIWYASVGRGANWILNVPPNSDGLISDVDVQRLAEFGARLKREFAHPVEPSKVEVETSDDLGTSKEVAKMIDGKNSTYYGSYRKTMVARFTFDRPVRIDRVQLREPLALGQRIESFEIQRGKETPVKGSTVGNRRVVQLPPGPPTRVVWLRILAARSRPAMSEVSFFTSP